MRYYHPDGTHHDHPLDNDFGWFCGDIVIDEATPTFHEENKNIKKISKINRSFAGGCCSKCDAHMTSKNAVGAATLNDVEESTDVLESLEYLDGISCVGKAMGESLDIPEFKPKPPLIYKIVPNIKEETPTNFIFQQQSVEGFIENPESNFTKQIKNCKIPPKEALISLISPVNPESKALLSVISYSKYRGLSNRETHEDVLKTINFKTTSSKRFISEPFKNGTVDFLLNRDKLPDINFQLNDNEIDIDKQLVSEIQNYHATKEDNMLSLMMELIITDMDSNLGDMSELNNSINELNNIGAVETSDLGNSIHSSLLSKEGSGFKDKSEKKTYMDVPNRAYILSSIGLNDDIDRSIEIFVNEKTEMHRQLTDIRKKFEAFDKEIDTLMDQAAALQNDLRETAYLSNLIHLLNGELEKVNNKKLPFRIFHQSIELEEANSNFII